MNIEETKEAIRVMQAFVDGKEVQTMYDEKWQTTNINSWNWFDCNYRIKPAAKLRPWTADEVPLGGQIRSKTICEYRWLIDTSGHNRARKEWFEECEHSIDGGKTWLPCGVVEEAK